MPSQSQIIPKVNLIFRNNRREFEFNRGGVCNGLSALYTKYALQDQEAKFFRLISQINKLPDDYNIGNNQEIDRFLLEVETAFQPGRYHGHGIQQSEIEKYITINSQPPRNDFNVGLICSSNKWAKIFDKLKHEKSVISVYSHNHVLNVSYKNGQYVVYDSNYQVNTKTFDNATDLVKEISKCFDMDEQEMGLAVRVFSNPKHPKATDYPSGEVIDTILNDAPKEPLHKEIKLDGKTYQSLVFAADAQDSDTVKKLINYEQLNINSVINELSFSDVLAEVLALPKGNRQKELLMKAIYVNLYKGNINSVNQAIAKYKKEYASQDNTPLRQILISALQSLETPAQISFLGINDYWPFLEFALANLSETERKENTTAIANLLLLSHLDERSPVASLDNPFNMSANELLDQIQWAASHNQHKLLEKLLALKNNLSASDVVFTPKVATHIDSESMRQLLKAGITINPDVLSILISRNDKYLLEPYVEKVLDTYGKTLKTDTLFDEIGSLRRIDLLIAMRENHFIKQKWSKNTPSKQEMQDALLTAIVVGNQDIVRFIKIQFKTSKQFIDFEDLYFLVDDAFKTERKEQLEALASLGISLYHRSPPYKESMSYRAAEIYLLYQDTGNMDFITQGLKDLKKDDLISVMRSFLNRNDSEVMIELQKSYPDQLQQFIHAQLDEALSKDSFHAIAPLNRSSKHIQQSIIDAWLSKQGEEDQLKMIKTAFSSKLYSLGKMLISSYAKNHPNHEEFATERKQLWQSLVNDKNDNGSYWLMYHFPEDYSNESDYQQLLDQNCLRTLAELIKQNKVAITFSDGFLKSALSKAIEQKNHSLIEVLINHYSPEQILEQSATELCKLLASNNLNEPLTAITNETFIEQVDFNQLYQHCCKNGNIEALEWVLSHDLSLEDDQFKQGLEVLFKEKTYDEIMTSVYQTGSSQLYQLVIRLHYTNPRASLIQSIEHPMLDSRLQKTNLYLHMLKHALAEQDDKKFTKIIGDDTTVKPVTYDVVDFLVDNIHQPRILDLLSKQYDIEELCVFSLSQKQFGAVGHILEYLGETPLKNEVLIESIKRHQDDIVKAYLLSKEEQSKQIDVREDLFKLVASQSTTNLFVNLMRSHNKEVLETIVRIEEQMLRDNRSLGGKTYRHSLSLKDFKNALHALHEEFDHLREIIMDQSIDMNRRLVNNKAIESIHNIKKLMAANDITSDYYLENEDALLLGLILNNPRLKRVAKLEEKLYYLIHHHAVDHQSGTKILAWSEGDRKYFFELAAELQSALQDNRLEESFLIPELQDAMLLYRQTFQALDEQAEQLAPKVETVITATPSDRATTEDIEPVVTSTTSATLSDSTTTEDSETVVTSTTSATPSDSTATEDSELVVTSTTTATLSDSTTTEDSELVVKPTASVTPSDRTDTEVKQTEVRSTTSVTPSIGTSTEVKEPDSNLILDKVIEARKQKQKEAVERILKEYSRIILVDPTKEEVGRYEPKAKKAAEDLLGAMTKHAYNYFQTDCTDKDASLFIKNCNQSVEKYAPALQTDISLWTCIKNLVKGLFAAVMPKTWSNSEFFKPQKSVALDAADTAQEKLNHELRDSKSLK